MMGVQGTDPLAGVARGQWPLAQKIVLVYDVGLGEYWIITYVKKYGYMSVYMIKHISMFYL